MPGPNGSIGRFAADVWWVAAYELGEAVRTRMFQLVLLGYAGGIAVFTWSFVELIRNLEAGMAATLGVPATETPGAMMSSLLDNGELIGVIQGFIGKDNDAAALLKDPVLALWTGMACMVLLPLVLLFSASGSVASEVKSRSVRYLAVRTGRLQIGLGKLVGQLLVALVAAALGAAVAWGMGMTLMVGNPPADLAIALLDRTVRAALWALPFAGLGLAASMWIPSPNGARVAAGMLVMAMPPLSVWLLLHSGPELSGRLADLALQFSAVTTWSAYWSTDPSVLAVGAGRSVVLAVVYYACGHVRFARRDL